MLRTRRQTGIVHALELTADRVRSAGHSKLVADPLHQIDQTPAYHAMQIRRRPVLDSLRQGGALLRV